MRNFLFFVIAAIGGIRLIHGLGTIDRCYPAGLCFQTVLPVEGPTWSSCQRSVFHIRCLKLHSLQIRSQGFVFGPDVGTSEYFLKSRWTICCRRGVRRGLHQLSVTFECILRGIYVLLTGNFSNSPQSNPNYFVMFEVEVTDYKLPLQDLVTNVRRRAKPGEPLQFSRSRLLDTEAIIPVFHPPVVRDFSQDQMDTAIQRMASLRGLSLFRMTTGTGKTTRVPIMLTEHFPTVVVVEPSELLVYTTYNYMVRLHPGRVHLNKLEKLPGVTYMSSMVLLKYLIEGSYSPPDALILDEAHTQSAEYRALIAWFQLYWGSVPIYMLSATVGTTQSTSKGKYEIEIEDVEIGDTLDALVEAVTRGLFSRPNVKCRTLLVVPDNNAVKVVQKVYKEYGIPCYPYFDGDDINSYRQLHLFLVEDSPRVAVSTPCLTTGVTIPVDEVWDFSMEVAYRFERRDYVTWKRYWRPCSFATRRQTAGRTGRLANGKAKSALREGRSVLNDFDEMEVMRLVCWLQLLGLVPDPDLRAAVVDIWPISAEFAATCLSLYTHPRLIRCFFAPDGLVYSNFRTAVRTVLPDWKDLTVSDLWLDVDQTGWYPFEGINVPLTHYSVDFPILFQICLSGVTARYSTRKEVVLPDKVDYWPVFGNVPESKLQLSESSTLETLPFSPTISEKSVSFDEPTLPPLVKNSVEHSSEQVLSPRTRTFDLKGYRRLKSNFVDGTITFDPDNSLLVNVLRSNRSQFFDFAELDRRNKVAVLRDFVFLWNHTIDEYYAARFPKGSGFSRLLHGFMENTRLARVEEKLSKLRLFYFMNLPPNSFSFDS